MLATFLKDLNITYFEYVLNQSNIDVVSSLIVSSLKKGFYKGTLEINEVKIRIQEIEAETKGNSNKTNALLFLEACLLDSAMLRTSLNELAHWVEAGVHQKDRLNVEHSIVSYMIWHNEFDHYRFISMFLPPLIDKTFYVEGTEQLQSARELFDRSQKAITKRMGQLRRFCKC